MPRCLEAGKVLAARWLDTALRTRVRCMCPAQQSGVQFGFNISDAYKSANLYERHFEPPTPL